MYSPHTDQGTTPIAYKGIPIAKTFGFT